VNTIITDSPEDAAEFIRSGGIVAFPTETVYGLGADVFNESAIEKIFKAKRRPADNPLIVHVSDRRQIEIVAAEVTTSAEKLINSFFPGPLTVVVKKRPEIPLIATAALDTVGIRMPKHGIAQVFLKACKTPVVAPSANISGRPSPTTCNAVYQDLNGSIDCILEGEATEIGLESTVLDCTGEFTVLLRPGAISIDQLRDVVPDIVDGTAGKVEVRSPGMRHKHYSPNARVMLIAATDVVDAPEVSGFIGMHDRADMFAAKKLCSNADDYARKLFEFFRECDRSEIHTIYCETVPDAGIGMALMDRLRRASER